MLTAEERAQLARQNGAQSKGPVTEEGKAKSRQNALKTAEFTTEILPHLFPPHQAHLFTEDPDEYKNLLNELTGFYEPNNPVALSVVKDIAAARTQIDRFQRAITMQWNVSLIAYANSAMEMPDGLLEIHSAVLSGAEIAPLIGRYNREIDRLQRQISHLERRLKFIKANFENQQERTQPAEPEVQQNQQTITEIPGNEPTIYITENVPAVIEAYKQEFPGRRIVILPPDAPTDYDYDALGHVPRRAA